MLHPHHDDDQFRVRLYYVDPEGDKILISGDDDLERAECDCLKLKAMVSKMAAPAPNPQSEEEGIRVRAFPGRDVALEVVSVKDTIGALKEKIASVEGCPVEKQVLLFDGSRLNRNECTLEDYNIPTNATLNYVELRTEAPPRTRVAL